MKYAKMPDSAGEDSEADSNAATSVAAHSDDDRSTTAAASDHLPGSASAAAASSAANEVDEVYSRCLVVVSCDARVVCVVCLSFVWRPPFLCSLLKS